MTRLQDAAVGLGLGALAGLIAADLHLAALVSYWGDTAPLVVLAAASGAAFGAARLRVVPAAAAAGFGLLWLAVAFTPVSRWLSNGLVREDPPAPADAVFVLGSRLQADGEPTAAALSRLMKGLELLGDGYAPRLVVSELPEPHPPYAAVAGPLLHRFNLPPELHAVGPVTNTRDEAVAVAELFAEHGWQRVLLVTSPTHTRRAAATFEARGLDVRAQAAPETRYDLETLDRPSERLDAFGAVMHERIGLWVYRRRGWL